MDILFLDEPSTGLDPLSRRKLWDAIAWLKQDKAVILTTHNMLEADYLGDTVCILHTGKVSNLRNLNQPNPTQPYLSICLQSYLSTYTQPHATQVNPTQCTVLVTIYQIPCFHYLHYARYPTSNLAISISAHLLYVIL